MMTSGAISVFIGMFPEMKTTEPYSQRPREGSARPPAGRRSAEEHAKEDRARLAAAFDLGVEALEHGLQRPHHERQADEGQGQRDPQGREGDLHAQRLERSAEPAVRGVECRERDARDGGREREREVD
jgi:hypothetical protein